MAQVNVVHEWDELDEVIVGRPLHETDRIWDWTPGMDEEFSHVKPETFDWLKANAGQPWIEADPELFAKINAQVANYVATLESRGIRVHQPPMSSAVTPTTSTPASSRSIPVTSSARPATP